MTRLAMTVGLGAMTLITGLFTCVVQSSNHERARQLSELQREWEMLEAANEQREAVAGAHVWGLAYPVAGGGSALRPGVHE